MIPQSFDFYTLKTKRLTLRLVSEADIPDRFRILSQNPDMTKFMTFESPKSETDTRENYKSICKEFKKGTGICWSIFLKDKVIGTISLEKIVSGKNLKNYKGVIGYWLDPCFQNQGFVTEALETVIKFGFESLELHKILVGCISENIGSKKVIIKTGFRLIGVFREHYFYNGDWYDYLEHELLKFDWERSKNNSKK